MGLKRQYMFMITYIKYKAYLHDERDMTQCQKFRNYENGHIHVNVPKRGEK